MALFRRFGARGRRSRSQLPSAGGFDFADGVFAGLKIIGFALWERKNGGPNVTFPARQYSVNGERRSFSLLRPIVDASAQDRVRDLILAAYEQYEAAA